MLQYDYSRDISYLFYQGHIKSFFPKTCVPTANIEYLNLHTKFIFKFSNIFEFIFIHF
jgi:hypothetical protein